MKLNKKYKDRLFCLLFGNEEYKENILSLYNALCNTAHFPWLPGYGHSSNRFSRQS